ASSGGVNGIRTRTFLTSGHLGLDPNTLSEGFRHPGPRLPLDRTSQIDGTVSDPAFPLSQSTTNLINCCKALDRRGAGRCPGGAEVARRWVRRKNSPFSSLSIAR